MSYPIPKEALKQNVVVLGKTGAGKSSVARVVIEAMLDEHLPVCIIDPKGDWWGIKLSADGKRPGYPLVIFGGKHADIPINEHAGAHIAELFATGNRPCVIDMRGWMPGARTKFFIDFASTLFQKNVGRRWLVIDECHNFAPKGKVLDLEAGKMLHWANRLANEGRSLGVTILGLSQRPQKVHNDFLTSCETLIALRVLHASDRGAYKDWIDGCGDPAKGKEMIAAIANLKRGTGYVWSPEIDFGPKLVKFPLFKTYDSFKPQEAGDTVRLTGWAEVDLDEVKSKLATFVKEAEENDPKKLRARIRELEQREGVQASTPSKELLDEEYRRGYGEGEIEGYRRGYHEATAKIHDLEINLRDEISHIASNIAGLDVIADQMEKVRQIGDIIPLPLPPPSKTDRRIVIDQKPVPAPRRSVAVGTGTEQSSLEKAHQTVLLVLNYNHQHAKNGKQLALLSGYGYNGHFRNVLGDLRREGLIVGENTSEIFATEKGVEIGRSLSDTTMILSKRGLREHWLGKFGKASRSVLEALLGFPHGVDAKTLCEITGYGCNGHFRNTLGELRAAGVLIGPNTGTMRPAPELLG